MDGFKKSFMSACIEYLDFICGYYHLKQNNPSLAETKDPETEISLDECHITLSEFEQILSVIRSFLSVYGTENDRNSWAKVDQAINEYNIPSVLQKQQEQLDINKPAGMLTENVANFFSSVGIPGGKQAGSKTSTLPGLVFLANKSPLSSEKMVQLINNFSPDLSEVNDETIQEETNRYFLFMFRKEWKIKQVIDDLRQKKKSQEARSNQVFNCMLKSLLDEHTYLP
jgi:hypothetical protein